MYGTEVGVFQKPKQICLCSFHRHKMVCAWKCRSHLPTSRVTSWTSHEKCNFQIRSSVLFWNWWISCRTTVSSWYFWGFQTFPALRNSFHGALPPMVGQSFLLAGSSLPNIDALAYTAIWANCWVGDDSGDLPTSPSCSFSMILFVGAGVHQCWEFLGLHMHLHSDLDLLIFQYWGVNQGWGFLCFCMGLGICLYPPLSPAPLAWCYLYSCHAGS